MEEKELLGSIAPPLTTDGTSGALSSLAGVTRGMTAAATSRAYRATAPDTMCPPSVRWATTRSARAATVSAHTRVNRPHRQRVQAARASARTRHPTVLLSVNACPRSAQLSHHTSEHQRGAGRLPAQPQLDPEPRGVGHVADARLACGDGAAANDAAALAKSSEATAEVDEVCMLLFAVALRFHR